MCLLAAPAMLPVLLLFPGLNLFIVIALLLPATVGGAVVFVLRRFVRRPVALIVGCILGTAAVGLTGWSHWECQAAMALPIGETDNDGTVRVLMMLVSYLVWATVGLIVAMALAFWAGARRQRAKLA